MLQLKAADFHYSCMAAFHIHGLFRKRNPDIAHHMGGSAWSLQDFAQEGGSCGFSVGACDGDNGCPAAGNSQFQFADNRYVSLCRLNQKGRLKRNTRADDKLNQTLRLPDLHQK